MKEWWADGNTWIGTIDSSMESGHYALHAHMMADGTWQYAGVRWFHHSPHLMWIVSNGVFRSED